VYIILVIFFIYIHQRAAQIRSSPFTDGDSYSESSSSDADDCRVTPVVACTRAKTPRGGAAVDYDNSTGSLTPAVANHKQPYCAVANSNESPCSNCSKRTLVRDGSSQSLASETSSDYALPPDDIISIKTDTSDVGEPPSVKSSKYAVTSQLLKRVSITIAKLCCTERFFYC